MNMQQTMMAGLAQSAGISAKPQAQPAINFQEKQRYCGE